MCLPQIPITLYGVLDQDVDKRLSLKFPQLYRSGQTEHYLNFKVFVLWALTGFWHAAVVFGLPIAAFGFYAVPTFDGQVRRQMLLLLSSPLQLSLASFPLLFPPSLSRLFEFLLLSEFLLQFPPSLCPLQCPSLSSALFSLGSTSNECFHVSSLVKRRCMALK